MRLRHRHFVLVASLAAMLAVAQGAHAAQEGSSGVWGALRLGWAFPLGSITQGDSLSGTYQRMIPVGVELGYHFGPYVYVAAYAQYGFVSISASLCPGLDCSAYNVLFEATAAFRLKGFPARPTAPIRLVPWFGIGVGYEGMHTKVGQGGQFSGRTDRAMIVDPELGVDFMFMSGVGVGPFAAMPMGEYLSASVENPTGSMTRAIADRKPHFWPMLGLRVFYGF